MNNSIFKLVEKYLNCTDESRHKDYQEIRNAFKKVRCRLELQDGSESDYETLHHLEEQVARKYLSLLNKYWELPTDHLPLAEEVNWKFGYNRLKLAEENRFVKHMYDSYMDEFKRCFNKANLDTKVILLSMFDAHHRRMDKLQITEISKLTEKINDLEKRLHRLEAACR
jgi:polyhydroxyalkanoate synthesis regulator phasin